MNTFTNGKRKALLYGGGIDSYCTYHLLKRSESIFDTIRFDLKTLCAKYEREAIWKQNVEIDAETTLDLGILEHDDAHLPYRNLMLAAYTASLGYDEIMLGGTLDDRSSDMTEGGFASMSLVLSDLESRDVSVYAPYGHRSKLQLVSEYMSLGDYDTQLDGLHTTFSCYNPVETKSGHHCLYCRACLRRLIYLSAVEKYKPFEFHNRSLLVSEYRRIVSKESDATMVDRQYVTRFALEASMTENEITLASKVDTYVVDIDGTLCEEKLPYTEGQYEVGVPKLNVIESINNLYNCGHRIIIYTSRHEIDRDVTQKWLRAHKVRFDDLHMNKLKYDYWIDDKALPVNRIPFKNAQGE